MMSSVGPGEGRAHLQEQLHLHSRGFVFCGNVNPVLVDRFMHFPRESENIIEN
jgi:hypothetical protein